jgi:hypothetical protein
MAVASVGGSPGAVVGFIVAAGVTALGSSPEQEMMETHANTNIAHKSTRDFIASLLDQTLNLL